MPKYRILRKEISETYFEYEVEAMDEEEAEYIVIYQTPLLVREDEVSVFEITELIEEIK